MPHLEGGGHVVAHFPGSHEQLKFMPGMVQMGMTHTSLPLTKEELEAIHGIARSKPGMYFGMPDGFDQRIKTDDHTAVKNALWQYNQAALRKPMFGHRPIGEFSGPDERKVDEELKDPSLSPDRIKQIVRKYREGDLSSIPSRMWAIGGGRSRQRADAYHIMAGVARHPNTPPETLWSLAYSHPHEMMDNPVLPLLKLEDPNWQDHPFLKKLAEHPEAHPKMRQMFLRTQKGLRIIRLQRPVA